MSIIKEFIKLNHKDYPAVKPCFEINKEQQILLNNRQIVSIKCSHYKELFHIVKDNFDKPLSKENINIIASPDLTKKSNQAKRTRLIS